MNKKRKFFNVFYILGLTFISTSLIIGLNNNNFAKNSYIRNLNNLKTSNNTLNTIDEKNNFGINNKSDQGSMPYGKAFIDGTTIIAQSNFNHELWRYDVSHPNSILKRRAPNATISNMMVKYNKHIDAIIVWGNNPSAVRGRNSMFLFMLNAKTGKEIIFSNDFDSLIYSTDDGQGINRNSKFVNDIVINPKNGTMILIHETMGALEWVFVNTNLEVKRYYNNFRFDAGMLNSDNYFIQNIFPINDDAFGFQICSKSQVNIDGKDYPINTSEILISGYDGKFIGKSEVDELKAKPNSSSNNYKYNDDWNEMKFGKPIAIPFEEGGTTKYNIVYSSIHNTSDYGKDKLKEQANFGSNILRYFTYDPAQQNGKNRISIKKKELTVGANGDMNSNTNTKPAVIQSLDYNEEHKRLIVTSYEGVEDSTGGENILKANMTKANVNFFKFDQTNASSNDFKFIAENIFFQMTSSNTNNAIIPTIEVINDDESISNNKINLIKQQIEVPLSNIGTNVADNNSISATYQYASIDPNNTSNQTISWNELNELSIGVSENEVNKWREINKKLPSDIPESELINWVTISNNANEFKKQINPFEFKNELEVLESENNFKLSKTKKSLYNNQNGKLKFIINSSLKKWWADNANEPFKVKTIIDETLKKYSDFSFRFIGASGVDYKKEEEIKKLKNSKPSEVSHENIINSFIEFGSGFSLTTKDVSIDGKDDNNSKTTEEKAINVFTNDANGTLTIQTNLSLVASQSMSFEGVQQFAKYDGFKKSDLVELVSELKLNDEKFNKLKKTRLSYNVSIDDLISCIDDPNNSLEKKDMNKWKITYQYQSTDENFATSIINGENKIKLEYFENGKSFKTENASLKLELNDTQKMGFKKLSSITGKTIKFNKEKAMNLASGMSESEINSKINSILASSYDFEENIVPWFDISTQIEASNKVKSTLKYLLSFKNKQILTNIFIFNPITKKHENLLMDETFINKIKSIEETKTLFNDFNEVDIILKLNHPEWTNKDINGSISSGISTIDSKDLLSIVDNGDWTLKNNASLFVNWFKENDNYKNLKFEKKFQLLKPQSSSNIPFEKYYDETKDIINYGNFQITKIELQANDLLGIVEVKYELYHDVGVSSVATLKVNNFASSLNLPSNEEMVSNNKNILLNKILIISSISIIIVFFILSISIFAIFKKK